MSDKSQIDFGVALQRKGLKSHVFESNARSYWQRHWPVSVYTVEPVPLCYTGIWRLPELSKDEGDEQGGTLADKGAL